MTAPSHRCWFNCELPNTVELRELLSRWAYPLTRTDPNEPIAELLDQKAPLWLATLYRQTGPIRCTISSTPESARLYSDGHDADPHTVAPLVQAIIAHYHPGGCASFRWVAVTQQHGDTLLTAGFFVITPVTLESYDLGVIEQEHMHSIKRYLHLTDVT